MKRIFVLIAFACSLASAQFNYYPTFVLDSAQLTRPADSVIYTAGDIVAGVGGATKYLTFSLGNTARLGARGEITSVFVSMDTSNAANTAIKVRFFGLSDTTGLWASLPVDNAVYQSPFSLPGSPFYWLGDTSVVMSTFGTTAGGATSTEGVVRVKFPYVLPNGILYAVLIANGAFEPKISGKVRVRITVDRQY